MNWDYLVALCDKYAQDPNYVNNVGDFRAALSSWASLAGASDLKQLADMVAMLSKSDAA